MGSRYDGKAVAAAGRRSRAELRGEADESGGAEATESSSDGPAQATPKALEALAALRSELSGPNAGIPRVCTVSRQEKQILPAPSAPIAAVRCTTERSDTDRGACSAVTKQSKHFLNRAERRAIKKKQKQ